jgi:hypothetical protein
MGEEEQLPHWVSCEKDILMDDKIKEIKYPSIDPDFEELSTNIDSSIDAVADTLRNISSVGSATQAGLQTFDLQSAIDNYAQALNQSAIAKSTGLPVRTSSVQYKGFAAEEYFKWTLKINSLAKGVPDWQLGAYTNGSMPDGSVLSGIDMETDISVLIRKQPWSKPIRSVDYQSKIHNDASAYAKDINNPQYENVEFVGGSGQGVNDKVSVNIGKRTISSDAITPEEATSLADKMKAQDTPEYPKSAEKHDELNKVNLGRAVAAGAATGLILTTVKEIIEVIKHRDNLTEEQFTKSIEHILCGTVDGAARGGTIIGSVQLLGKVVGKEIAANSLEAIPAMAITNTAVDFAKDLYKCFVSGTIDADDLLCNTVNNTFSSIAGFGGGWAVGQLGGQIAGQFSSQVFLQGVSAIASAKTAAATGAAIGAPLGPIGSIVGSVIGGIVIGYGANAIIGTANKDASKAFSECLAEINSQIELSESERWYYFADSMSSISNFRLSFKDLLPCYNIISDLREYNLHKKAIKSIHEQLNTCNAGVETAKIEILRMIEEQHSRGLKELQMRFNEQREAMFNEFRESMNIYVANSYSQYISLFDVLSGDIEDMKATLNNRISAHNSILEYARNRNKTNEQLNETLTEIIHDPDYADLLKPFVEKLSCFMQQDELVVGRQYLSFDEALYLTNGVE